jgi:hypothetical protein
LPRAFVDFHFVSNSNWLPLAGSITLDLTPYPNLRAVFCLLFAQQEFPTLQTLINHEFPQQQTFA